VCSPNHTHAHKHEHSHAQGDGACNGPGVREGTCGGPGTSSCDGSGRGRKEGWCKQSSATDSSQGADKSLEGPASEALAEVTRESKSSTCGCGCGTSKTA